MTGPINIIVKIQQISCITFAFKYIVLENLAYVRFYIYFIVIIYEIRSKYR